MTIDNEMAESVGRNREQMIVSKVNYYLFTKSLPRPGNYSLGVEEGLAYITSHFQNPVWPRAISTKATEGRHVVVDNEKEALARYKAANGLDCRISAFPPNATENPSAIAKFQGVRTTTPSNLIIMMDLDRSNFKSDMALELALSKTIQTVKRKLNTDPTVLWSGRGYHIVQVIDASDTNLESEKIFTDLTAMPSRMFMQFTEDFLSNGKSDKSHNNTVSFGNCMLRIPGSINSKNNQMVRLIKSWDGCSPKVNHLLADFCIYLANKKAQALRDQRQRSRLRFTQSGNSSYTLQWIERLLLTSIADGRKYAIWRILVPYLINRRHLSEEQCTNIIVNWLVRCGEVSRLGFDADYITKYAINHVRTFGPVYPDKIRQEHPGFYNLLVESKII
jgi:hypothetical protein